MQARLRKMRTALEKREGAKEILLSQKQKYETEIEEISVEKQELVKIQAFLQKVAQETSENLKYRLCQIVNMALKGVFGAGAYRMKIDFTPKRGKTDARIYFVNKEDNEVDPSIGCGGGVLDVAAFALRLSLIRLEGRSDTVILDEPFRFVSKEYKAAVAELIETASEKLGYQTVMVTHEREYVSCVENVVEIEQINKVSRRA